MFSGERVRQAREIRLMTQEELAARIGKSQAAITHIERGFKDASQELIEAVSHETGFPFSFFCEEPTVKLPLDSLLFRAQASMTRKNAVAACHYAAIIYEMMERLSAYVNPLPLKLDKTPSTPQVAAQEARRWMGLDADSPIPHLIYAMERSGIVVIGLPIEVEGIDAFSCSVGPRPMVAVCSGKPGDRLRWSAAHELGHLVLHSDRKIRTEEHREADQFAGELLLPERMMRHEIRIPVTLSGVASLKPRWGVSIQALVRRAFNLRIITERQYRYLFEQLSVRGWRTREPENLDIAVEKPRALRKMVELSPFANDSTRLAAELRITVDHLGELLSSYEVTPFAANVRAGGPDLSS